MTGFVLRRLAQTVVVIALLSFFCYFLMTLMPGDPIDEMVAANPTMTAEDAQRLRELHGLDQPAWKRYWNWVKMIAGGDLSSAGACSIRRCSPARPSCCRCWSRSRWASGPRYARAARSTTSSTCSPSPASACLRSGSRSC